MLGGLGLCNEVHKALVTGTHTHPHSHTLWLLRLKCEVSDGRGVEGERGESLKGKEEAQLLSKLEQLCSEAIDKVPKEVSMLFFVTSFSPPLSPPQHSLSLWQFWLEQLKFHHSPHPQIQGVFQVNSDSEVYTIDIIISLQNAIKSTVAADRVTLSMQYIDWAVMMGGAKCARNVYKK